MTLPNFLIIGAGRSGTTSLYHYLEQHPDVYMSPIKEARYFAYEGKDHDFFKIRDFESYEALFDGVTSEKAIGEASPDYLFTKCSPERIKTTLPEAKLIVILRDPADRAYSHYLILVRNGIIRDVPFARIVESKPGSPDYEFRQVILESGYYNTQIRRYLSLFPDERMKIVYYDDLRADAPSVMSEIYEYLGVDPNFSGATSQRHNASIVPKSAALHWTVERFFKEDNLLKRAAKQVLPRERRLQIYQAFRSASLKAPEKLDRETRAKLIEIYRDEIVGLQQLVDRDLSKWLRV